MKVRNIIAALVVSLCASSAAAQQFQISHSAASGNPKDIVNAYPDQFETVGDLIHQKRVEE